jgi:hypothetical protein
VSDNPSQGNAWDDLFAALTLLRRSQPDVLRPFNCAHDTLWVDADVEDFTDEELAQLVSWGFFPEREYGVGGFVSYRFGSA